MFGMHTYETVSLVPVNAAFDKALPAPELLTQGTFILV